MGYKGVINGKRRAYNARGYRTGTPPKGSFPRKEMKE
jgi:hypothetical protein